MSFILSIAFMSVFQHPFLALSDGCWKRGTVCVCVCVFDGGDVQFGSSEGFISSWGQSGFDF